MEIITSLIIGSLVGWTAPLFGRGSGPALLDMLIGALGGVLGVALNALIHADSNVMVVFGAALLLAIFSWGRGRFAVTQPTQ